MTTNNHAKDQAAAQLSSIRGCLAALNCDYERLEELRELAIEHREFNLNNPGVSNRPETDEQWNTEAAELAELEAAAHDCKDQDEARECIQEDPLSVQVRSGWANPGETFEAEEFAILLCTGGPAVRIMGDLDEHNQPSRAYMQYQDWGTPWTDYFEEGMAATCLEYAQQFYFGD